MIIRPGPWLPDQADLNNPGSVEWLNVIPSGTTPRPFYPISPTGSAASSVRVQGAGSFRSKARTIFNFAGDISKLYKLDGSDFTWDDVSKPATTYATPADGMWRFFNFGDLVIATNGNAAPQVFNLNGGATFDNLGGSPPAGAKFGGVVGGFAVLCNSTADPALVQWSALEDAADWVASAVTQSDAQSQPDGGEITGFVGGESGLVLQEQALRKMVYEGPPLFFRFDKITETQGCLAPNSVASHEGLTIFLAADGLYAARGGSQLAQIGREKVDRWLLDRLNQSYLDRVSGAIDPNGMLYYMAFPTTDSTDGTPDQMLVLDIASGNFSHAEMACEFVYTAYSQSGYTADTIDQVIGNTDATDLSADNTFYTSTGRQGLAGFSTAHKMGFFDGPALEAIVTTMEAQLFEGRRAYIRGGVPLVQGATTPSLALGYRDLQSATVAYTSDVAMNSGGYCAFGNEAVFHRGRLTVAAGESWEHIIGMEPDAVPAGAPR